MSSSPFTRIFLATLKRIKEEVPAIQYISPDLGQLEGYSTRPAVAFPCVLHDFNGWVYENLGDGVQAAEGDVIIKLGFAQYGNSSNLTEPQWLEESLKYWDIENDLNKALHGWSPGEYEGYYTRTSTVTENRPMGVRVVIIRYRMSFEDKNTEVKEVTGLRPSLSFSSSGVGT